MQILVIACGIASLMLYLTTAEAKFPAPVTRVRGVILEQRGDVKSLAAWNAPSYPYYVLKTAEGKSLSLRPSARVGTDDLRKLTGRSATLKGYYAEGVRPAAPLESITEQVPVEPKFINNAKGQPVEAGQQVMKRGSGFVVLAVTQASPAAITMPGTVLDYEWAHEFNRLALLVADQDRLGKLMIVDAERGATVVEIAIPDAYRPSCFAWLGDDSGFLLAMAKPEPGDDYAEETFYRYGFAEKRFEPVYPGIERQYADIFSIETDSGTAYWAAASVGEGHPDLAIYRDGATVLLTDVYPGSVAPVFWQDHRLWMLTEAYLEFGFTREERARNPRFDQRKFPERAWGDVAVYRIDPATKQASPDNISMAALDTALRTSHDHRYRAELVSNDQSFTLAIKPAP